MRFFLKLSYNGTNFHGWQRQPNAVSIQETIENALSTIFQKEMEIVGAGRTDAGVHAREMYAHLDLVTVPENLNILLRSLNNMVGKDIDISGFIPVREDAHARFDALHRTYRYYVRLTKNPFDHEFVYKINTPPDIKLMNECAQYLLTVDDFTSFAKLHTDNKTNICNVMKAEWSYKKDDRLLIFEITADRFLRNMVRSVVGTLLSVGAHKINMEKFKEIIEAKDRCKAGTSVPARGLFLEEIEYPEDIFIR